MEILPLRGQLARVERIHRFPADFMDCSGSQRVERAPMVRRVVQAYELFADLESVTNEARRLADARARLANVLHLASVAEAAADRIEPVREAKFSEL